MAEAIVDGTSSMTRFFCHRCNVEIENLRPVSAPRPALAAAASAFSLRLVEIGARARESERERETRVRGVYERREKQQRENIRIYSTISFTLFSLSLSLSSLSLRSLFALLTLRLSPRPRPRSPSLLPPIYIYISHTPRCPLCPLCPVLPPTLTNDVTFPRGYCNRGRDKDGECHTRICEGMHRHVLCVSFLCTSSLGLFRLLVLGLRTRIHVCSFIRLYRL
jgi:hypothetical protein